MSRFRFRLQDLLKLTASREQARAGELAQARQAESIARLHADTLHALQHAGAEQVAAAHGRGTAAGSIQQMNLILEQLAQHRAAAANALSSAEEEVARCQVAYTSAAQERRVLDKLRERRHETWRIEQAQEEQKQMDEIATGRKLRGTAQNGGTA